MFDPPVTILFPCFVTAQVLIARDLPVAQKTEKKLKRKLAKEAKEANEAKEGGVGVTPDLVPVSANGDGEWLFPERDFDYLQGILNICEMK